MEMGTTRSSKECPICLEFISGEAFLDPCFHKFCYQCILQWSEIVAAHPSSKEAQFLECPLCKTHSTSIIHNIVGETFRQHYLFGSPPTKKVFSLSEEHTQRLAVYRHIIGPQVPDRIKGEIKPGNKVPVVAGNRFLKCWVQRELQALMQEEDVEMVVHHVIGILEYYEKRQRPKPGSLIPWKDAVSDAARPFIFERADKFGEELIKFLLSGLDIAAYDQLSFST